MSQTLIARGVNDVLYQIKIGQFDWAADRVFFNVSTDTQGSLEFLRQLLPYRNQNPKLMYAIEKLLDDAAPEMHDKVVRSLDAAGWYGHPINNPELKIQYLRPKFKVAPGRKPFTPTFNEDYP